MKKRRFLVFMGIILILSVISYLHPENTARVIKNNNLEEATLIRVIDGDTIETSLGKVRLLGINSPEKNKYLSEESTNFLKQFENKTIHLLMDVEEVDKYKRLLRYVYYNDRNLNLESVEKGLSTVYIFEDLRFEDQLLRAQDYAKASELGLWEPSNHKCGQCITVESIDPKEEVVILNNLCYFQCNIENWQLKDSGRREMQLQNIPPRSRLTLTSEKAIWNDDHDELFLRDEKGLLALHYKY